MHQKVLETREQLRNERPDNLTYRLDHAWTLLDFAIVHRGLGQLDLALQEDQSQETNLNNNITTENERISVEQANLTTELNQANFALQEIPSQLNEINEIYSSLSGYNQNPS